MQTIRSISIGSAFKVGAVTSILLFAVIGGLILLLQLLVGGMIGMGAGGREGAGFFGAMAGFGIVAYLFGIIVYGIIGGIGSALTALKHCGRYGRRITGLSRLMRQKVMYY